MYCITQEYTKLIEEILKRSFNDNFTTSTVKSLFEITNKISTQTGYIFRKSFIEMIEILDFNFFNSEDRKNDYYSKVFAKRALTTIFGDITFKRHSYVKKNGGKSFFTLINFFS